MNRLLWLVLAIFVTASGCKKTPPPAPESPKSTPETATSSAPTPAPGTEGAAATDTPPTQEGTPTDPQAKPPLDPESAEIETILRKFVDSLAAQKTQDAYALMIDQESCLTVMKDTATCDQILLGQAEGRKELEADPVPFNSQIIEIFVGQKQEMGEDKGAKIASAIWVGNVIRARSPEGTEFMMKSLGVLKTGKGLKILWGKRRSGPDGPRSVAAQPPTPTPTPPGATGGTQPNSSTPPPPATAPSPAAAVPEGQPATPTPPVNQPSP